MFRKILSVSHLTLCSKLFSSTFFLSLVLTIESMQNKQITPCLLSGEYRKDNRAQFNFFHFWSSFKNLYQIEKFGHFLFSLTLILFKFCGPLSVYQANGLSFELDNVIQGLGFKTRINLSFHILRYFACGLAWILPHLNLQIRTSKVHSRQWLCSSQRILTTQNFIKLYFTHVSIIYWICLQDPTTSICQFLQPNKKLLILDECMILWMILSWIHMA